MELTGVFKTPDIGMCRHIQFGRYKDLHGNRFKIIVVIFLKNTGSQNVYEILTVIFEKTDRSRDLGNWRIIKIGNGIAKPVGGIDSVDDPREKRGKLLYRISRSAEIYRMKTILGNIKRRSCNVCLRDIFLYDDIRFAE